MNNWNNIKRRYLLHGICAATWSYSDRQRLTSTYLRNPIRVYSIEKIQSCTYDSLPANGGDLEARLGVTIEEVLFVGHVVGP